MKYSRKGFTIVELLVVVSIIALLVGILLPAIGKAQDQAKQSRSQANLKQIGTAIASYAAEFQDRQPTYTVDNIASYAPGTNMQQCQIAYFNANGADGMASEHPWLYLGANQGAIHGFPPAPNAGASPFSIATFNPITFEGENVGWGTFRVLNTQPLSGQLNGRFYDPIWYAPKDTVVMSAVEQFLDYPGEYTGSSVTGGIKYSSYCLSPAAMYNPAVFSKAGSGFFTDPFDLKSGFKSPAMSQAQFSNLKTHVLEHHWLQRRKKECSPYLTSTTYPCEPYYFNQAFISSPVTLFFDGHVDQIGQEEAMRDDAKIMEQMQTTSGLWSRQTPMGTYFSQNAFDWSQTSYHIFTVDGIKGRDILAKGK